MTGASVTNKGQFLKARLPVAHLHRSGIYYEQSKEPPIDGPPKLHLLIESNEEFRVCYNRNISQATQSYVGRC